jgi:hypothetical protein
LLKRLFSPNPARIARFDGLPKHDAVAASLVNGSPGELKADLTALVKTRLCSIGPRVSCAMPPMRVPSDSSLEFWCCNAGLTTWSNSLAVAKRPDGSLSLGEPNL